MDWIIVNQLLQMSSRIIADASFSFPYYATVSGRSFCLGPLHTDVLFSLIISDKIPVIWSVLRQTFRNKGLGLGMRRRAAEGHCDEAVMAEALEVTREAGGALPRWRP